MRHLRTGRWRMGSPFLFLLQNNTIKGHDDQHLQHKTCTFTDQDESRNKGVQAKWTTPFRSIAAFFWYRVLNLFGLSWHLFYKYTMFAFLIIGDWQIYWFHFWYLNLLFWWSGRLHLLTLWHDFSDGGMAGDIVGSATETFLPAS